jgi:hypothetical protein
LTQTPPLMPAAGLLGLFGPSFDDPHERAASGALVNGLALNGFPAVLAVGHGASPSTCATIFLTLLCASAFVNGAVKMLSMLTNAS